MKCIYDLPSFWTAYYGSIPREVFYNGREFILLLTTVNSRIIHGIIIWEKSKVGFKVFIGPLSLKY